MYKDFNEIKKINDNIDYNIQALNNAIRNILLTRRGSMPGKPTFGSDIYKVVFSQLDSVTISLVKRFVFEALLEWEPRINLDNVEVISIPEYNKMIIVIKYSFRDKETLELIDTSTSISITQ